MIETDAWVLHAGPESPGDRVPGELRRERFEFADPGPDEVLVEPLFACWEANLNHAISRSPIDVCHQRGEPSVVLGNTGAVRVLRAGPSTGRTEGEICLVMPFGRLDRYGYVELALAYDAPGTYGLLARRTKLPAQALLPLPGGSRYPLSQWAAVYGRHFTAWDNWKVAYACWRAQMPDADPSEHLVFGWGGGVALAELELARRAGFTVAMTASRDDRLAELAARGIVGVDRREFADLSREGGSAEDEARRAAARRTFRDRIGELSGGRGVSILVDNIGGPLHRPGIRSLARQGVLSTVGWRAGMDLSVRRASECINRHLHVHTHVWRYDDCATIRDFCENERWLADPGEQERFGFDDVPRLAAEYGKGTLATYFPVCEIAAA